VGKVGLMIYKYVLWLGLFDDFELLVWVNGVIMVGVGMMFVMGCLFCLLVLVFVVLLLFMIFVGYWFWEIKDVE